MAMLRQCLEQVRGCQVPVEDRDARLLAQTIQMGCGRQAPSMAKPLNASQCGRTVQPQMAQGDRFQAKGVH